MNCDTLDLKACRFTQGWCPHAAHQQPHSPVPPSTRPHLTHLHFRSIKAFSCSEQNHNEMLQVPCSPFQQCSGACLVATSLLCSISLSSPPPGPCKTTTRAQQRSAEKKSHHHVCSTDDFIPITCSCHAKQKLQEKV